MAEHDRSDHAEGRRALLATLANLSALEDMLTPLHSRSPSPSVSSATDVRSTPQDAPQKFADLVDMLRRTLDDLGNHMAIESGQFLPHFESLIDTPTSRRLAREYARTLVLSPAVTVRDSSGDEHPRRPLFAAGVLEYVSADLTRLRACYEAVLQDARNDGGAYLDGMVEKEIERLQVGKWLSLNERTALREGGGDRGGDGDAEKAKL